MSFKNVRTFLENRIKEIDSDFSVVDKPFNVDDPGALNFNKRFHIFYGNISTTVANQQTTADVVNALVTFYFDGYRDQTEALDESIDVVNKIRMRCLQPKFLVGEKFIKRVIPTGIVATPIDSNDNKIKVELSLSISTIMASTDNLDC